MTETHTKAIPWDTVALGMNCYEIESVTDDVLQRALRTPGLYTVRVDPLASKQLLHSYGFYYCDSLIEPYCAPTHFTPHTADGIEVTRKASLEDLLRICHGAFSHGHFHRDFNVPAERADVRYDNWLKQLYQEGSVCALRYHDDLAGFIALQKNKLLLHAMAPSHRGKGLAKYFWSTVCAEIFDAGHAEVSSSISCTNLAVLNLYASLGFRFRNPIDIYHRVVS